MNEATDALMATLGEYDALWDGTLPPEIIDAELYDCPREGPWDTLLPSPLCFHNDPVLIQLADRHEAMLTLIEVIKCYVETCVDTPLFSEETDGMLYDCPVDLSFTLDPPQDWPSVESLK